MGPGARTGALVIVLKSLTQQLVSAGCTPVEQVVEPDFHHLDIAIAGAERIARKDRGRGWNEESPVAQPEIVVFELHRPIVREGVFKASADQPAAGVVAAVGECAEATAGDGHARREVGDGQVVVADPATAGLAVEQPVIDGDAEAAATVVIQRLLLVTTMFPTRGVMNPLLLLLLLLPAQSKSHSPPMTNWPTW